MNNRLRSQLLVCLGRKLVLFVLVSNVLVSNVGLYGDFRDEIATLIDKFAMNTKTLVEATYKMIHKGKGF